MIKIDELVKSRHSRENGNPENIKLIENNGFQFADRVGDKPHGNDMKAAFWLLTRTSK